MLAIETLSGAGSSETIATELIGMAPHTLFIVDEVHQYYNLSDSRSRLLQAVSASPKFLVMTATPAASTRQLLAREWLRRCVNFPVACPDDVLVAGRHLHLGPLRPGNRGGRGDEVFVTLTEDGLRCAQAPRSRSPGGWGRAARVVRDGHRDASWPTAAVEPRRGRIARQTPRVAARSWWWTALLGGPA